MSKRRLSTIEEDSRSPKTNKRLAREEYECRNHTPQTPVSHPIRGVFAWIPRLLRIKQKMPAPLEQSLNHLEEAGDTMTSHDQLLKDAWTQTEPSEAACSNQIESTPPPGAQETTVPLRSKYLEYQEKHWQSSQQYDGIQNQLSYCFEQGDSHDKAPDSELEDRTVQITMEAIDYYANKKANDKRGSST